MNIISWLADKLHEWGGNLSQHWFSFALQITVSLGLASLLCFTSHLRGSRSMPRQVVILIGALLVSVLIPVGKTSINNHVVRTWVLILSVVGIWFLPKLLPKYVVPELGRQRLMTIVIYAVIGVLVIGNFMIN